MRVVTFDICLIILNGPEYMHINVDDLLSTFTIVFSPDWNFIIFLCIIVF